MSERSNKKHMLRVRISLESYQYLVKTTELNKISERVRKLIELDMKHNIGDLRL